MCYQHFASPKGFYMAVLNGLEASPRYLPERFLYDDSGSRLFLDFGNPEDHYLMDSEFHILNAHNKTITSILTDGCEDFNLVEFCPGAPEKRTLILNTLLKAYSRLNYFPLEVSQDAVRLIENYLAEAFPTLIYKGSNEALLDVFNDIPTRASARTIVLLLGQSLSCLNSQGAEDFLNNLRKKLKDGDMLTLGSELKKSPKVIQQSQELRNASLKELSMNLLKRINRELNADFEPEKFDHFHSYNPVSGTAQHYLISSEEQLVTINGAHLLNFDKHEAMQIGISQAYTPDELSNLAKRTGFKLIKNFSDVNGWFANSIWVAI
jgi:L-histidine N-alpha-methyltransferase